MREISTGGTAEGQSRRVHYPTTSIERPTQTKTTTENGKHRQQTTICRLHLLPETLLAKGRFEAVEKDPNLSESKSGFRLTLLEAGAKGNLSENWTYRVVLGAALEVTPYDIWTEWTQSSALRIRAGQFKAPFGKSEISRTSDLLFPDRPLVANLAPNRDIGVQLHGEVYEIDSFDSALMRLPELASEWAADPVYISIDIDVIDPAFAPGTAHRYPGGSPRATCFAPCDC